MVVTVALVITLAAGVDFAWQDMDTGGLYAVGVLLGLIYTEHYQRWQEARTTSAAGVTSQG